MDKTKYTYEVLQDRVIEVTYDAFDFDAGVEYLAKYDKFSVGGCSAVKACVDGKVYVGRNYDFYCSESPAFIVRNNSGLYRTIGIGNSPSSLPDWADNDTYNPGEKAFLAMPLLCCDVMSETGIYCETNIRIGEDGLACAKTNPGKPRRCTQAFMQTMLTQYDSINDILSHIDDYDWFDLTAMGFCQSFFLVDQSGYSTVVEFATDCWSATPVSYNSNYFLNTNFYAKEKWPAGVGRVSRELALLPTVHCEDDIFGMMKVSRYAQFYTTDVDIDLAVEEFMQDLGYSRFNLAENMEDARSKTKELLEKYSKYTWDDLVQNKCWESTFSTVANVTDLSLNVHYSEHYGIQFKVSFE